MNAKRLVRQFKEMDEIESAQRSTKIYKRDHIISCRQITPTLFTTPSIVKTEGRAFGSSRRHPSCIWTWHSRISRSRNIRW